LVFQGYQSIFDKCCLLPANKWLVKNSRSFDCQPMMMGRQILREGVSAGATGRLDRGFTEPDLTHWLHQVAGRIRLAVSRRIPVGFEDETGFHPGVPPGCADDRKHREQAGMSTDDKHF
jgi:hypothetical protein